jgi:hypothetical protein
MRTLNNPNRRVVAPLITVSETVKSISFTDLESVDRSFFQRYFFDFTGLSRENLYANHAAVGLGSVATKFAHDHEQQPRRFSLGAGLSRGQYYTVCQSSDGDSGQTLAMEILNYANTTSPHVIEIVDLKDPAVERVRDTLSSSERTRAAAEGWRTLLIQVRTLGSPVRNAERRLIPYQLRQMERNAVFDLRTQEALAWLFQTLNSDWPNAIFLTAPSKNQVDFDKVDQATGGDGPPLIGFEVESLSDHEKTNLLLKLQSVKPDRYWSRGLSQTRDAGLKDYHDLFAYLLAPEDGGNLMTTVIALYLHYLGADAIIFPSARENCSASDRGYRGFNLVDFTGIHRRPAAIYIVEEPSFFVRRRSAKLNLEGAMRTVETAMGRGTDRWRWGVENHRSITIRRHRWLVLKNYLQATFPDYEIPNLLVGKPEGDTDLRPAEGTLQFHRTSDILCGIFDGTLKLNDQAWGFYWMTEFNTTIQTLGDWLAEFASRQPLFGMQPRPFHFDGARTLYTRTPGSLGIRVCVCCGWQDAQSGSDGPQACPSCGFTRLSP